MNSQMSSNKLEGGWGEAVVRDLERGADEPGWVARDGGVAGGAEVEVAGSCSQDGPGAVAEEVFGGGGRAGGGGGETGSGGAEVELAAVGGEGVVGSLAVGLGCPAGEEAALGSLEGGRVAAAAGEGCCGQAGLGTARRLRRSLILLLCTRWPRWRPSLIIIIIIIFQQKQRSRTVIIFCYLLVGTCELARLPDTIAISV